MLTLSLLWLLLGILIGFLANLAQLQPVLWTRLGWLFLIGIGAITALSGGWIGTLLFGRYFATAMALWIAIASVTLIPRKTHKARLWLSTRYAKQKKQVI